MDDQYIQSISVNRSHINNSMLPFKLLLNRVKRKHEAMFDILKENNEVSIINTGNVRQKCQML